MMKKAFIYGVSVVGENFTDRVKETSRLMKDFENGQNVILISPRRMGKTSLVRRVQQQINSETTKVVYIDIYDCRSELDFYRKFASSILSSVATKTDQVLDLAKRFLTSLVPKLTFSPSPDSDFSLSLGLNLKDNEESQDILNLPERIATKLGIHIVICIDEFQQIGEMPDSLTLQKRLRSQWQLQEHTSYCLFGSKRHMLMKLFGDKRMPFYQFGDTIYLEPIPTKDWVPFICQKFEQHGMLISESLATSICEKVQNHSSYVQQLAWNVMLNTEHEVTEEIIEEGLNETIRQNIPLFQEQIKELSSFQMNYLRALCQGIHSGFTSKTNLDRFHLGAKSNINRLHTSLIEKELIEARQGGDYLLDPIFEQWFSRYCMR